METMSSPAADAADLLDLKFLPAWVKEPSEERKYDYVESEEARGRDHRHPRGKRQTFKVDKTDPSRQGRIGRDRRARHIHDRHEQDRDRGLRPVSRAKDQYKP